MVEFTREQLSAIERRHGDLFLEASAGSGKTSVLVERFVRAVVEDGVELSAILTITFTDKAAAEMRERIRERLLQLGAEEAARATEGAFISTIHGFCARVLRANSLTAGIDPRFTVLDPIEAARLKDEAFEEALAELAENEPGGVELIAAYGAPALRGAILATFSELRSGGQIAPRLPALPAPPEISVARREFLQAAADIAHELGGIEAPGTRVVQALERLERCQELIAADDPWPGDLEDLRLPAGNGGLSATAAGERYAEAVDQLRAACEHRLAQRAHALLDHLLESYGTRYGRRKREGSVLDFEDLELLTQALLDSDHELRERYRDRFERIMVDELQDTNAVQLQLIESLARGNLFTVGDAHQSIYLVRHADLELFERAGEQFDRAGARATLQTNFRSRREILEVVNSVFTEAFGERFAPLRAGRTDPPASDPRVELILADRDAEWSSEGLAAAWRVAEARALARRVQQLIVDGAAPKDVVVLTRATTDLRVYERALEERGIPTYVIGGRGYWSHPQVVDVLAYLRTLANPRDEEALYTVLASPLVGCSADTLVVLGAAARDDGRDPWWVLCQPEGALDELDEDEREQLARITTLLVGEREAAPRKGVEELIDRALAQTGYDLAVLAMPGGRRRLANVRKLMRLAREYEAARGRDLRGFLDLVHGRFAERAPSEWHESEAPIEAEALDAVRMMTIHRAKGLEFEIVCVADLGRGPRSQAQVLRVASDGRLGLRLARPGTGRREPALDYETLGDERRAAEAREERRLFYVAMTRAKERLVLSGAAKVERLGEGNGGAPIAWLGPALITAGVEPALVRPEDADDPSPGFSVVLDRPAPVLEPPPPPEPAPPVTALSYSTLAEYERCGYRFYVERVLGVPGTARTAEGVAGRLSGAERGTLVHTLLETLDFRRPVVPRDAAIVQAAERAPDEEEIEEVSTLLRRFAQSELCARLGRASSVRREQRFGFLLEGVLIVGVLDAIARERPQRVLIVDYKTDRLEGADPTEVMAREYATQRLVYALAGLRAGDAREVEVAHAFLEAPDRPVCATFTREEMPRLEAELAGLARGVLDRRWGVSDTPHRALCNGCPAEGGLCSWSLEMTRRETAERLF